MARRAVHWPWAPVIIGSVLILLSIVMRMYEFDQAFINLVASAGDVVVIFSLLYIIKIFLIDENPMPQPVGMNPQTIAVPSMLRERPHAVAANVRSAAPLGTHLADLMAFAVTGVDEAAARVSIEATLSAHMLAPRTAAQATLDIMKNQHLVKDKIRAWAQQKHGSSFTIATIDNITIERTPDGGVCVRSSYSLGV